MVLVLDKNIHTYTRTHQGAARPVPRLAGGAAGLVQRCRRLCRQPVDERTRASALGLHRELHPRTPRLAAARLSLPNEPGAGGGMRVAM